MPEPRRSVETEARVAAAAILEHVFDASQEPGEVVDPLCAHVGQGDLLVKRKGAGGSRSSAATASGSIRLVPCASPRSWSSRADARCPGTEAEGFDHLGLIAPVESQGLGAEHVVQVRVKRRRRLARNGIGHLQTWDMESQVSVPTPAARRADAQPQVCPAEQIDIPPLQSPLFRHWTQMCPPISQTGVEPPQSVSLRHWTQVFGFTPVLHTGRPGTLAQSAALAHSAQLPETQAAAVALVQLASDAHSTQAADTQYGSTPAQGTHMPPPAPPRTAPTPTYARPTHARPPPGSARTCPTPSLAPPAGSMASAAQARAARVASAQGPVSPAAHRAPAAAAEACASPVLGHARTACPPPAWSARQTPTARARPPLPASPGTARNAPTRPTARACPASPCATRV